MKEPQPHDSQNQIIEPSDYRYITVKTTASAKSTGEDQPMSRKVS